jgi:drug/metabolite transporter (DMT)-like permease
MSEKEDKLKECKLNCSNQSKQEENTSREQSTHPYLYKSTDEKLPLYAENIGNYSTVAKSEEASIQITDKTTAFDLWKGLFYMFLSCVFKSLFSVLSKYTLKDKRDLSSFQLLTYRTYFMLWITILVVSILPINVFSEKFVNKDKIIYVIIRTIFAIISMSLVIFAIKFLHISDVYSVYYVYPAFIILLSFFYLKKEKLATLDYLCLIACFVGALLIVKPEFLFQGQGNNSGSKMFYFGLVLIAAFLKALEDVLVRNVGKNANSLVFPFMYSIFGMVLFPLPMIIFDKTYPKFTMWEVFIVFLIALCTFLYQMFMALGLQNESASRVSMVNYAQVALMFISDLLIFDKSFNMIDLIGTFLIFGFNFANGFYKVHKRWKDLNNYKLSSGV